MIQLVNIEKSFGSKTLFSKIKYQFPFAERIALVGANGAGKTTLLNIIIGIEKQDDGDVIIPSQIKIGYLPQSPNPHPEDSILEEAKAGHKFITKLHNEMNRVMAEISEKHSQHEEPSQDLLRYYEEIESQFLHADGFSLESRAVSILQGLGFDQSKLKQHPTSLSGGWRMRLELARILVSKPDFLVLDEPTNHLDLPSLVWIESWLMTFRGTLLFVSHDRELLNRLPTIILSLEGGQIHIYKGNFDQFLEQRDSKIEQERARSNQLRLKREAMEDFVKRFGAKATKAKQAQSRLKMIERIRDLEESQDEIQNDYTFSVTIPEPQKTPRLVCELEQVSIGYKSPLAKGINCIVEKGAKIAVIGANGIGKSTFLKTLSGSLPSLQGKIIRCPELKISYFSQDHSEYITHSKSILDTFIQQTSLGEQESRNFLGGFKFRGDDIYKKTTVLSGGELSRLALACAIARRAGLLLLDEPTNHLDMVTVEGLIASLEDFDGTIVFVSHDRNFINGICTHVFAMLPDGRSRLFLGKLDDYERLSITSGFPNVLKIDAEQNESLNRSSATSSSLSSSQKHNIQKEIKAQRNKLEKKLSSIERDMATAKLTIESVTSEMLLISPDKHQEIQKMYARLKNSEILIERLEAEWLVISEQLEELNLNSLSNNR
jgi:ATP-binding cassette subfamily F protein 3